MMKAWKFGDDIDTDAIIPGRYLTVYDPQELAAHVFEGTRDEFREQVKDGDVLVAGRNFGCGSSREHAPIALKGAGIHVVIAKSFARIFYRNAVNTGLMVLVCQDADRIPDGSQIEIHLSEGVVEVEGHRYPFETVPDFMKEIVNAGGLVPYAQQLEEVKTCTGSR
jgi:3-isopropylmalate/(R)-2-methylmalate dehydratase small subunit